PTSASASIVVNCPSAPNVSVLKTAASSPVAAGASASFNIVVTAGGTGDSTNVILMDLLPVGHTWTIGGSGYSSTACGAATRAGGTTLTCSFGTLASGDTRMITLTTTTTAADCLSGISNTANVASSNDTNSANNSSS